MEITQVKIRKLIDRENVRALASITVAGDLVINDIRVIQKDDRLFVAMPSRYNVNEHSYHDVVHPITTSARAELEDAVLSAYHTACAANTIPQNFSDAPDPSVSE